MIIKVYMPLYIFDHNVELNLFWKQNKRNLFLNSENMDNLNICLSDFEP